MFTFRQWMCFCCVVAVECAKFNYPSDKKDWVNPNDMLRYDTATKTMKDPTPVQLRSTQPPKPIPGAQETLDVVKVTTENLEILEIGIVNGKSSHTVKIADGTAEGETSATSRLIDLSTHQRTDDKIDTTGDLPNSSTQKCDCNHCGVSKWKDQSEHQICEKCDLKFVKRFTQRFVQHFSYEKSESTDVLTLDVKMTITKDDLLILEKFVARDTIGSILEVDEIMARLVQGVKLRLPNDVSFDEQNNFLVDNAAILLTTGCALLVFVVARCMPRTNKGLIILSFMIVFVASWAYEWVHLYQKLEADKSAIRFDLLDVPVECKSSQMSILDKFTSLFKEDRCKKYYRSMMINSLYEVTPMTALTSMIGKQMEAFFDSVGTSLGKLFANSTNQMSWLWQPFMFVAVFLLFLYAMNLTMQYFVLRPMQRPMQTIQETILQPINNVGQRHMVQGATVNRPPMPQLRGINPNFQQPLPADWTAGPLSPSQEPYQEQVQVLSTSQGNYYVIRRQQTPTSPLLQSSSPSVFQDEAYYISGEMSHPQHPCRRHEEAGGFCFVADANSGGPSGSQHDPSSGSLPFQQSEQAEKIAKSVSQLADTLEKELSIGRREASDKTTAASNRDGSVENPALVELAECPRCAQQNIEEPCHRSSPSFIGSVSANSSLTVSAESGQNSELTQAMEAVESYSMTGRSRDSTTELR